MKNKPIEHVHQYSPFFWLVYPGIKFFELLVPRIGKSAASVPPAEISSQTNILSRASNFFFNRLLLFDSKIDSF